MQRRTRNLGSRVLIIIGGIGMLVGAADPLEGSLVILPAFGLVTLGTLFGEHPRRLRYYWLWLFVAMAAGVAALFALSAAGGLGGKHGHSVWWGLLLLPYPIAWLLGMANLVTRLGGQFRRRAVG